MNDPQIIPSSTAPDSVADTSDTGADMNRRDRYQAGVAVLFLLDLLNTESQFECVYCEQIDDILVKKTDGKFMAIQVKTREEGLPPWTCDDGEFVKSARRFMAMDATFPERFAAFVFATNQACARPTARTPDLHGVLANAQQCQLGNSQMCPELRRLMLSIVQKDRLTSRVTESVLPILSRTSVLTPTRLPSLDMIEKSVAIRIGEHSAYAHQPFISLAAAARSLVNAALAAGALPPPPIAEAFECLLRMKPDKAEQSTIDRKRLDHATMSTVLGEHLTSDGLLQQHDPELASKLSRGYHRLERKMAAGGLSVLNVDLAKSNKASAEKLFVEWANKFKPEHARAKVNHVLSLVQNECQEAHDRFESTGSRFGPQMLADVRKRLRQLSEKGPNVTQGCQYQHLLGVSCILTEECKIWWSDHFSLDGTGNT